MKRRIKAVIWILMAALALGGCSLAREDAAGSADQFVGVNVVLTRLEGAYEAGREYELDGSESYLALIEETDEGTGDKSVGFDMGAWFMEPKQAIHINDVSEKNGRRAQTRREETYAVEASVYAAPDGLEDLNVSWRLDPVYRRADGTLYAVSKANRISLVGVILHASADPLENAVGYRQIFRRTSADSMRASILKQEIFDPHVVSANGNDIPTDKKFNFMKALRRISLCGTKIQVSVGAASCFYAAQIMPKGQILLQRPRSLKNLTGDIIDNRAFAVMQRNFPAMLLSVIKNEQTAVLMQFQTVPINMRIHLGPIARFGAVIK